MKKLFAFLVACLAIVPLSSCDNTVYVNFFNYDGTLLWKTPYSENMELAYEGETPTRPSDEMYDYTFTGWNHSLKEAEFFKNYYALYSKDLREFKVTFKNDDGSIIETIKAKYGQNITNLVPASPTKENELRTHYYFARWEYDNDLTYVTSDFSCTAFYSSVDCFKIDYYDHEDTLIHTEYVERGAGSYYSPELFYQADENHFYVFSNWDVSLSNIQNDIVAHAQYKIVDGHTVTFKNYDSTFLGVDKVPDGYTAHYSGPTPSKPSETSGDYIYSYTFHGWDKNLTNVKYDFETKATFSVSSYNYRYGEIISSMKEYVRQHGAYEEGNYAFVFSIDTPSSGYIYTGILMMEGYSGPLNIFMSSMKADSTGTKAAATHLYLSDSWNGGYFNFTYQFVVKNSSGTTTSEDQGGGRIYGPSFNNNSSVNFNWYTGSMAENAVAVNCAAILSMSLDKFARSSTWSMVSLGFNNYNY